MTSVRCLSLMGRCAALCGALALTLSSASAQAVSAAGDSTSYSSSNAASPADSGLNNFETADVSRPGDTALPSAPSASGSGGQYDNRSRPGGGSGGLRSHLTYEVGGGFNAPTDESSPYIGWGGNFTVGAGYRFDQHFSMNVEYQYIHSKLPDMIVGEAGATGGYDTLWSFTLAPMYEVNPKSSVIFYGVGGGGFYRKVTNFTDPQQGYYCDYFGFCYSFTSNQVFDHYSNNAGGLNGGLGFTYKMGRFSSSQLYAEARYAWVNNQPSQNSVGGLYPENNKRTGYFPVTVGFRF